ncbi:MAG: hypothetical protein JXQ87_06235 [Bacteroidia bacterium]
MIRLKLVLTFLVFGVFGTYAQNWSPVFHAELAHYSIIHKGDTQTVTLSFPEKNQVNGDSVFILNKFYSYFSWVYEVPRIVKGNLANTIMRHGESYPFTFSSNNILDSLISTDSGLWVFRETPIFLKNNPAIGESWKANSFSGSVSCLDKKKVVSQGQDDSLIIYEYENGIISMSKQFGLISLSNDSLDYEIEFDSLIHKKHLIKEFHEYFNFKEDDSLEFNGAFWNRIESYDQKESFVVERVKLNDDSIVVDLKHHYKQGLSYFPDYVKNERYQVENERVILMFEDFKPLFFRNNQSNDLSQWGNAYYDAEQIHKGFDNEFDEYLVITSIGEYGPMTKIISKAFGFLFIGVETSFGGQPEHSQWGMVNGSVGGKRFGIDKNNSIVKPVSEIHKDWRVSFSQGNTLKVSTISQESFASITAMVFTIDGRKLETLDLVKQDGNVFSNNLTSANKMSNQLLIVSIVATKSNGDVVQFSEKVLPIY